MSEYQYYEFQAIDEPLDQKAMAELRAISSRARITPTSFVNTYNWGNFRGDPYHLMTKYFDAFVYATNWNYRQFMLRFPRHLVDEKIFGEYCVGHSASCETRGKSILLNFSSESECDEWEDGGGWLSSLIPLRADILAGNFCSLYLGWLLCADSGEVDEDTIEPPVPPGLQKLSASLKGLIEFLRIDDDLVTVAAECSPADEKLLTPSENELKSWIRSLKASEKNAFLLRTAQGAGPALQWEILKRFRQDRIRKSRVKFQAGNTPRRTVGALLDVRDTYAKERQRRLVEQKAKTEARHQRQQAAARKKYLDSLSGRIGKVQQKFEALIQTRQPKSYDQAVELLMDLRDVAQRSKQSKEFIGYIQQVRQRHAKKTSLLRRLDHMGL